MTHIDIEIPGMYPKMSPDVNRARGVFTMVFPVLSCHELEGVHILYNIEENTPPSTSLAAVFLQVKGRLTQRKWWLRKYLPEMFS